MDMMPPEGAIAVLEPSSKRRQMLEAAERLFLTHGYGAVSMDAIARAANVSKATLYAHFASKDALFASVVSDKGTDNPLVESCFPADVGDLRETLILIGQRVLRFMLRDRTLAIYRVAIAESARFPELGAAFFEHGPQRFCNRFRDWLLQPAIRAHLRDLDGRVAAEQFMALLRCGVFMRATLTLPPQPSSAEIDATVTQAVETWLEAYARPSLPRPA